MEKIFGKYPTLGNIWNDYDTSKLYLTYPKIRHNINEDLIICGIQKLFPSISDRCYLIGRLDLLLNIYGQIVSNQLLLRDTTSPIQSLSQIIVILRKIVGGCKEDVMVVYLVISQTNREAGHANILLINKANGTIERFEPNVGSESLANHPHLNRYLSELVDAIDYVYISPISVCPRKMAGWQSLEARVPKEKGEIGGYCLIWSFLYTYLRLAYPEVDASEIITDFSVLEPKTLRQIIRTMTSLLVDLCTHHFFD